VTSRHCCALVTRSNRAIGGPRIASGGPRLPIFVQRCLNLTGWIVPTGILALLPKCPTCLAAYFAIGSGIVISGATATYLRAGLLVLCLASLAYFAVSRWRRLTAWLAVATPPSEIALEDTCR
jgi:hypothetical protein